MSKRTFRELMTPFLREKLAQLESTDGPDAPTYLALARQYVRTAQEEIRSEETNLRHYDAEVCDSQMEHGLPGLERLYRRTLVIEPTLACAAHCRHCIRANYPPHNLSEEQLLEAAKFCGYQANRRELREVLVTGGDPWLVPQRVDYFARALIQHAPNIRVLRIATRVPLQAPELVNEEALRMFQQQGLLRLELATQVNHRVELFPEVLGAFRQIMERNVAVYAQNVLLRGVNDDLETLVDLYDALRDIGIQPYYLFHCVPLVGLGHLRTTVRRAVDLGNALTCSGRISGRAKPMLAAMTDIGKIVLYDGVIVARDNRHLLLQSRYHVEDRRRWNQSWRIPKTAEVDGHGHLRVWYLDGDETCEDQSQLPVRSEPRHASTEKRRAPTDSPGRRRERPSPVIQQCV